MLALDFASAIRLDNARLDGLKFVTKFSLNVSCLVKDFLIKLD